MVTELIEFSLRQRLLVVLASLVLVGVGLWSAVHLTIDAVPDITSPQVQINSLAGALAAEEVEKLVTFPIESEMAGLPDMTELRSLSRFGFSQITMVFRDGTDVYRMRQLVSERLINAKGELPDGITPQLAPISTGLGDIFFYTLDYKKDAKTKPVTRQAQLQELKQIQEYLIKPLLRATKGVAEVNTSGGYERQIVVSPDPARLTAAGMTVEDLSEKIKANTENAGGGLLEISGEQLAIRSDGRVRTVEEIAGIPLKFRAGTLPMQVKDVADVGIGTRFRTGASTEDGDEALLGGAIMLSGENSRLVAREVLKKIRDIQEKLPEGVELKTVYDRSDLVNQTIRTVQTNLFEGAILVVVVLFLLLGNIRAALIVALAIPLSMLFAITGMVQCRISGNLMSLGAIDFGLIVDGSVVMVENIIRHLAHKQAQLGRMLTPRERVHEVLVSARQVASPMFFGVMIVTVVYIPILALTGIEGKMFHPMALTVIMALVGSLILALTLMPVLCSYFLSGKIQEKDNAAVEFLKWVYAPLLQTAFRFRWMFVGGAIGLFVLSLVLFTRLGAEFIPQLDEGSLSIQMIRSNSVGLGASVDLQQKSERLLLKNYPEISHLFSRIGTAEVATDPMGPNVADTYVFFHPKSTWRKIDGKRVDKALLIGLMREDLTEHFPQQSYLFTQPIQLRFNEIMAGSRSDVSLKIFGDSYETLEKLATQARDLIRTVPGAGDVEFDALGRTPLVEIKPKREVLQQFNVHTEEINRVVEQALAGAEVGSLIEGNRRYDIVVRLPENQRQDLDAIRRLPLRTDDGGMLMLGQVAEVQVVDQIGTITRESTQRRVAILINPRGRDLESFVLESKKKLKEGMTFPDGYYYEFGGQFENLQKARERLLVVVPLALILISFLIFMSFGSLRQTLLILLCVPLAVTGGILALWVRGLPFSISAAVGFIALSGIATLNGIMLISFINQLRGEGRGLRQAVVEGTLTRLRPKLMTALVASLGFVPMALATGPGAEVQRPLATVVIGGILTSSFLTLIILPVLYDWLESSLANPNNIEES
ncbi:MAG: CusA/CzcA family heavy metal efflux RND transporter [Candidatus Methylacidiphilales bacterium]|nr:CusA/CzcA family heavy metal efflux RND transporter [Candidatus Methylacidiphilales bacterium]